MLLEEREVLINGDKATLFRLFYNRSVAAVNTVYLYEKAKAEALWKIDERYHEQSVQVLYERFSYAMAMIARQLHRELGELYDLSEAQKQAAALSVYIEGAIDEAFRRSLRDFDLKDATSAYYEADFLDEKYEKFWEAHRELAAEIDDVRAQFTVSDKNFMHGFDSDEDFLSADSRDFLHIMRIYERWGRLDISKFLTATKREYLPMIIRLYLTTPKIDVFAAKSDAKWWQIWKR